MATNKKLLVFEFATGGGLIDELCPKSFAEEGFLMLKALVNDLIELPDFEITVLLDKQFKEVILPESIHIVWITAGEPILKQWQRHIQQADFVFPIAPDMHENLEQVTELIESENKIILGSSSSGVRVCSDKRWTIDLLLQHHVSAVDTELLGHFFGDISEPWVLKPRQGVGCTDVTIISKQEVFAPVECVDALIIQPYIRGDSLSLSCLFKEEKAWLICVNRQQIEINSDAKISLHGCEVNIKTEYQESYQDLINQVAKAIPYLWGYVGIDIIQRSQGEALILEINPRLTRSYAGISEALSYNVAKAVVELVDKEPCIDFPLGLKQVVV